MSSEDIGSRYLDKKHYNNSNITLNYFFIVCFLLQPNISINKYVFNL